MFCMKCGSELRSEAKFCHHCGTAATANAPSSPAAVPPPNTAGAAVPTQQSVFDWKLVRNCVAVGVVLAVLFSGPPVHLKGWENWVAFKAIGIFVYGFAGFVAGSLWAWLRKN